MQECWLGENDVTSIIQLPDYKLIHQSKICCGHGGLIIYLHNTLSYEPRNIYTTKIDGVVCPPNISETVAGRLMKLAHRQCIASTTIKLISTIFLLSILSILVKTIQRIVADPKRTLSPPFDSADSVSSLGHPAPGSGNMLPLFTVPCDYPVLVTEIGAPGSGKTIQPIRM